MTETTLEEASRCPKCKQPGELTDTRAVPRGRGITPGSKLLTYTCRSIFCKWLDTVCRIIQVMPDGSIAPEITKREKQFPAVPDIGDKVNAQLERQLAAELGGGAELNK